jgi:hypothetical protein
MPPEYRGESATGFLGFGNPAGSPPEKSGAEDRAERRASPHTLAIPKPFNIFWGWLPNTSSKFQKTHEANCCIA